MLKQIISSTDNIYQQDFHREVVLKDSEKWPICSYVLRGLCIAYYQ